MRNLVELHRFQAERFGPLPALRYRRHGLYRDLSWADYRAQALAAAAAFVESGIQPGDRVGLLGENCVQWLIADMAILTAGAVNVPPHAPLTARQIHFQLADAGVRWLFVSTAEQLKKVDQVRDELPELRGITLLANGARQPPGAVGGDLVTRGLTPPVRQQVMPWYAFLQRGMRALQNVATELTRREAALNRDSLATIMYTSGTTGNPKGVMLTHGNLLSNSESVLALSPYAVGDVVLNWLPYSHIYARTIDHYVTMLAGVLVCLADSADTVLSDLEDVRPMRMAAVPRFYEKVLTHIGDVDATRTRRELRRIFGPRVDWLASGGAPLPLPVAQHFAEAGVLVLQGYGLTETSPVISFNSKEAYKLDTVGRPVPGVEVQIAPDGEIMTRGPHVMPGYWNNPEATAAALKDGWFYTGDLGTLDADGFLKITGRKKELLVLSNGKKVVPSFIEGLLLADPCIDQAAVHGEGRNFLTAVIVPHWDNVCQAINGVQAGDAPESMASNPAVRVLLAKRIQDRLAEVSPSEQVKKFLILSKPFSVADEELTVSLKLRRNVVIARHLRELEELYREQ